MRPPSSPDALGSTTGTGNRPARTGRFWPVSVSVMERYNRSTTPVIGRRLPVTHPTAHILLAAGTRVLTYGIEGPTELLRITGS